MIDFSTSLSAFRLWAIALAIAIGITAAFAAIKPILLKRLEILSAGTKTLIDDALIEAFRSTRVLFVAIVASAIGLQVPDLPVTLEKLVKIATTAAVFLQIGLWCAALLSFWLRRSKEVALASNAGIATSLSAVGFIGQVVLWSVIALLALDNLGVNISALIAGLGVGGIAVALAVQNILGDLFASLSIVIDKPFVIGDFIIIDDYMGTVENVGLKTTRLRSLGGEQIVFANSDLLKNRVRNYKRMRERRVIFGFGVVYQTSSDQLESIPALIKKIVTRQKLARFERAHCAKFADSSIDFEVVYWMLDPDYTLFMDTQQAIIFELKRSLEKAGVQFAFPTRTIVVDGAVQLARNTPPGGDRPGIPLSAGGDSASPASS